MYLETLTQQLKSSFSEDICYPGCHWSPEKPSTGHCAVTALIVQEELGGEIAKVRVGRSYHYFNIINDTIVDLTADQFDRPVNYINGQTVNEKQLKKSVYERYVLLKSRCNQHIC